MTTNGEDVTTSSPTLSEEERAALFRLNAPIDRGVRSKGGRAPISPKAVVWMLTAFAVLGLGGAGIEHFIGNYGVTSSTSTKFLPSNANLTPLSALNSMSVDQFMALKEISNASAPTFTLRTQRGHTWKLAHVKGRVIVLTFENATCNDICPVLGNEISQAQSLLGRDASKVEFAIINTDPRDLAITVNPPALKVPALAERQNVVFLNGSLPALNSVWTSYGIRVRVGAKSSEVSHNNVIYFITAKHQLVAQATPFATQNSNGAFSLKPTYVARFAKGIATTADSLVK
jgi:cytochrome oxidase Cu insertion factor (SCO1/SenC/PrrC family)